MAAASTRLLVANNGAGISSNNQLIRSLQQHQQHFGGSPSLPNSDQIEMTTRQRREANLGIVLVSISVLFILCQSVKIIPDLYEVVTCRLVKIGFCGHNQVIDSLIDISHLLLAINSSVNVIIYTLRGNTYLVAFKTYV